MKKTSICLVTVTIVLLAGTGAAFKSASQSPLTIYVTDQPNKPAFRTIEHAVVDGPSGVGEYLYTTLNEATTPMLNPVWVTTSAN